MIGHVTVIEQPHLPSLPGLAGALKGMDYGVDFNRSAALHDTKLPASIQ